MGHAADLAEVLGALRQEASAAAPSANLFTPAASAVLSHAAAVGESLIAAKSHSQRCGGRRRPGRGAGTGAGAAPQYRRSAPLPLQRQRAPLLVAAPCTLLPPACAAFASDNSAASCPHPPHPHPTLLHTQVLGEQPDPPPHTHTYAPRPALTVPPPTFLSAAHFCRSWENNLIPYLAAGLFGGDKGPATLATHALHRWALRHMGEPPVVRV